jgi:RHS repeat-associated protein
LRHTANTWQPSSIEDPGSNTATITYPGSTSPQAAESAMNFNGSTSTVDAVTFVDSLGRAWLQQKRQGQSSTSFDTVETKYDYMDRPITVSVPYVGTYGAVGGSTPVTTTTYDALSRVASVTDGGGGQVQYTYNGNDVLQTVNAPAGENPKKKQSEFDGLGRLSSVCEVVTNTAAGTPTPGSGACSQTYSQNGYWTKYTRNALGQITQVVQNAQGSPTETRSFAFDWIGRMTSESNPENGTTSYVFDTDTTCGTSQGDMVKRTDAAGNVTCYAYDLAHRVVATTYPSGPNASNTPEKHFVFDTATVDGTAMSDAQGRLAEAFTGPSGGKITDLGFTYDALGNTAGTWESTPSSGGWYTTSASYYANRAVNTLSVPGAPVITYGLDGEGRTTSVGAASGQNPVTAASYGVFGLTGLTLGSSDTDAYNYDPNTGRMAWYKFTVNGQVDQGTFTWNANGTLAALDIADAISSTTDTQTCTYVHDDLARLWSVSCPSHWSQSFSLDPFGNSAKTATTGTSFSASFNVKNQITAVGGFTPNYDSNGNLLDDPSTAVRNVNSFDSEGRPVTLESVSVTYDALDRAVQAGSHEFVYGPGGTKLAIMSGGTNVSASVPLPGGGEAVYSASTLQFYRHADNLGSSRLASTPSRALFSSTAYAPEGEPYQETGTQDRSFTGQKQDIATGQYDFLLREYSPTQGRWWVPDPAGVSAADPNNPQSWNRYAYVGGMPLSDTDPIGLLAHTCEATAIVGQAAPAGGCGDDPAGDMCHWNFFFTGYCFPSSGPLVVPSGPPDPDQGGGGGGGGGGLPQSPTTKPPSGPVCVSAAAIDEYLKNTPLHDQGANFYKSGQNNGVNPALAVAIAYRESSLGRDVNNTFGLHNAWGWGHSDALHAISRGWDTWAPGIEKVDWQLGKSPRYLAGGMTTVAQIYGLWCASGCEGGVEAIDSVLAHFGVSPSSLRFKACTEDGQ